MSRGAFPKFVPHIEVWIMVIALVWLGYYAYKVIQPKAVAAGEEPITRRQKTWFILAVITFWIAADFPMHDIAEKRLYSVHMVQHALLMLVFPPMILLATPTWLARLLIGKGTFKKFVNFWCRPAPALIVNLAVTALMHWAWLVNTSVEVGWFHYLVHVVAVFTSLMVWMPIFGPLPELRTTPPVQIVMLVLLSIIPTIPASFLTVSEGVLYEGYNHGPRLWSMDIINDQQLAGVMMKVVTGFYLWGLIAVIFFRWALGGRGEKKSKFRGKLVTSDGRIVEDGDATIAPASPSQDDGRVVDGDDAADDRGSPTPSGTT